MSPTVPVRQTRLMAAARLTAAATVAGLLSACATLGPDHAPPDTDPYASEAFVFGDPYGSQMPLARWWTAFDDAELDRLIERGLAENRTLTRAAANLQRARAELGLARLERAPEDTVSASYLEARRASASSSEAGPGSGPAAPAETLRYGQLGVSALWELDLFGRIDRMIESAAARAEASEAALADLQLVIIADIADAYVSLRGLHAQLRVANDNVENQQETLALVRDLQAAGRATELEVQQTRVQLANADAVRPILQAAIAERTSQLAVLVGVTPAHLEPLIEAGAALPLIEGVIAAGDPAALLRRRPDIREREWILAAATADIGVNLADAFPRLSLLGDVGFSSAGGGDLFGANALNFALGPQLSWSVVGLAGTRQRVAAARASAVMAFAEYEQAVLMALAETETALARQAQLQRRIASLRDADAAAVSAADLARLRYETGATDFLNVLDADRVRLDAANQLAAARTELARAQVAVFRALRAGSPPGQA